MSGDLNITAIIPARGGSKGIPRKNLKEICGKPLVAHAIAHAKASRFINRVVVNSEDCEIRDVAASYGAEVMGRLDEFAHDNTVQEVDRLLVWSVRQLEDGADKIDILVLLYPTAPLRDTATIDMAIAMVAGGNYDSALSLYEDKTYLWKRVGDVVEPINYDPATRGPRQKETWNQWVENKAIYVMKRDLLIETGCRLGGRIGCVEMDKLRSIDIDSSADLRIASSILENEQD